MDPVDQAVLALHVLGAAIWVGGSILLGAVIAPTLAKRPAVAPEAIERVSRTARRLAWVMWPALLLSIVTGLHNLSWYLPGGYDPATSDGELLTLKFALVGGLVVAAGAHTFWAAPKARRLRESSPPTEVPPTLRRLNGALGALSLLLGLAVVAAGVLLAGSGP